MVSWTNTNTLTLIDLYEKEPCIWNPKHRNHKDKIKVSKAWERISDAMGISVDDIKKKKETLMAAFRLNHKKVMASHTSCSPEDEIYKPSWTYYEPLASFLADLYDWKPNTSNEDIHKHEVYDDEECIRKTIFVEPCGTKKRKSNGSELFLSNKLDDSSDYTIVSERQLNRLDNECDLYAQLLAGKLKKIDEPRRTVLMHNIDNLVFQELMNQNDNPI